MKIILVIAVTLFLSACYPPSKERIVSPADAYVCFPSLGDCPQNPIPKDWWEFYQNSTYNLDGGEDFSEIQLVTWDQDPRVFNQDWRKYIGTDKPCGKIVKESIYSVDDDLTNLSDMAKSYREKISYKFKDSCAIFYSPILVSQWFEDLLRLKYAVQSCERVMSSIELQLSMLDVSDEISSVTELAELRSISAQAKSYEKQGFISPDDKEQLINNRSLSLKGKQRIQDLSKEHRRLKEFSDQVSDSILKIELAKKTLDRTLFYIEETRFQSCSNGRVFNLFKNGSWITKGSTVLYVEK